jgi:hypothetical protein
MYGIPGMLYLFELFNSNAPDVVHNSLILLCSLSSFSSN